MDAIITIASHLMGRDYNTEAPRTMSSLELGDLDVAELRALVE